MSGPETSDRAVEILERTTPYRGYFRIDRYRLRHRRFDGGWTGVMTREVFERGHAVAVLPYDPERDRVVILEQFRIGALAAGLEPWLLETVAGIIEPEEAPEAVAIREAYEEAGCKLLALEPIGRVLPSPGGCSEVLQLFVGRIDSAGLGGLHGLPEEHEDIRASVLGLDEALARLAEGAPVNASLMLCLQWLALNRDALRARWRAGPPS